MKKGQFVIIDLRNMDFMKDKEGNLNVYDTEQEAAEVCGMYEFDNAWVCELKYNHIENEQRSIAYNGSLLVAGGQIHTNK